LITITDFKFLIEQNAIYNVQLLMAD